MFDLGMTELLLIGIVALIVVGPKDLPGMFRTLGRFTGKMRRMAREFSRAMEDAADEAGVKDVAKDLKGMSNPGKMGLDKLNEAADRFEKWDPSKPRADDGAETAKLREERAQKTRAMQEKFAARKAEADAAATAETRAAEAAEAPDPGMVDDTAPAPKPPAPEEERPA